MSGEGAQFALVLERIGGNVIEALSGLPEATLNLALTLPETNTLFALATHLVGASEFWVLTLTDGRDVHRDRPAEFSAAGSFADLAARYAAWIAAVHEVLDPLPDAALDAIVEPPTAYRGTLPEGQMTLRECLMHVIEHAALHLGHIEITRQLLA